VKSSTVLVVAIMALALVNGCASPKQNAESAPPKDATVEPSPTPPPTDEETVKTEPLLTEWTLKTEHGDYAFQNIGWKETLSETTRVYDMTSLKFGNEISYRYRVFKVGGDSKIEIEKDETGSESDWTAKSAALLPKSSSASRLDLTEAIRIVLNFAQNRTANCASHVMSKKFAELAGTKFNGSVLLNQHALFYADRALSNITSAFEIESSEKKSASLKTFIQDGPARITNGADIDAVPISVWLITANSALFSPVPTNALDLSESYSFGAACEAGYRSARAAVGKKSPELDNVASQYVDRYLKQFPNQDVFGNEIIRSEKIY
jgi:hypothetical protein